MIFFLSTSRCRASKRTPPRFRSYRSLFFFPLAFSSFVTPGVLWRDAATGSVVVVSNCYVLTSALDRVKEDIGERRERRGFFFREKRVFVSLLSFFSLFFHSLSLPTLESLQEKTNLKQKGCEVLNLFISRTTKTERERRRSGGRTALSFFFFFFLLFFFFFFSFFFCFLKASAAEAAAAARRPQEGEEAALPPPRLLPPPPPRPRPPWPGSAASPARRSAARTRPS